MSLHSAELADNPSEIRLKKPQTAAELVQCLWFDELLENQ